MTIEQPKTEKPKPQIFFPEVKEIIKSDPYLRAELKELSGKADKKGTLRHSQRITNLGYLLAKYQNFSEQETKWFVEACLLHDIGKMKTPDKYLARHTDKFTPRDLEVMKKHAYDGYKILKEAGRSSRVYNPVLLHHQFQDRPYPETDAKLLRKLAEFEDADIDNARLLAIIDNFDTRAFGRVSVGIKPLPLPEVRELLKAQFDLEEEEDIIDFLVHNHEKIKKLEGE